MSADNEDYSIDAEMAVPRVWQALESVGHLWTFDSRSEEMLCKDCDWYAEGPFIDCATKAVQHRDDVKRAVLELTMKALLHDAGQ